MHVMAASAICDSAATISSAGDSRASKRNKILLAELHVQPTLRVLALCLSTVNTVTLALDS
jgi:hypothetical protein